MIATGLPQAPTNFLTVRVGCTLAYEADYATAIFLLIHPHKDAHHIVHSDTLSFGDDRHIERLIDPHGNQMIKAMLVPGLNKIRHDMILSIPERRDNHGLQPAGRRCKDLPYDVLRYTLPSRYCESDKLKVLALSLFGQCGAGLEAAQKVCDWTHQHIEYRYGSGDASLSACEAIERRYGVCRDFAHVMVALCRALGMPARYVSGHMPLIAGAEPDPDPNSDIGIDFHAYVEVYIGDDWHVFDPRHNKPHLGRIKVAHGMDAVDVAFATFSENVRPIGFEVWAHSVSAPAAAQASLA